MSQNILKQRLQQLNPKLIDYPFSENFSLALDEACHLGKIINPSDRKILGELIKAVLYIIIPKENFKQEIIERLQIPPAYAEIINQVIQQRMFEPLKDDLEQYKHLLPKKPFEITKPLETPRVEPVETKKLNIPERKIPTETMPKSPETLTKGMFAEVPKKEGINKPKPLPDLSLPEVQEIKIERPVNRTGELKRVTVPSVSPEDQEKIHSRLMEAMNEKKVKPKIIEEMKKVVIEGIKKPLQPKPKPKTTLETEEAIISQVIGGEGKKFIPQEKIQKSPSQKPYILDAKLKEEKEVKQEFPKKEIEYRQPPPEKPFGEA